MKIIKIDCKKEPRIWI